MFLTFSWRRPLSYRYQFIDLLRKSMDWFLYDNGLRHERVKNSILLIISELILVRFLVIFKTPKLLTNTMVTLWHVISVSWTIPNFDTWYLCHEQYQTLTRDICVMNNTKLCKVLSEEPCLKTLEVFIF